MGVAWDRPEDVPEDVWLLTRDAIEAWGDEQSYAEVLARALMKERDRSAAAAGRFLMTKTPLPVLKIVECEEAVRASVTHA